MGPDLTELQRKVEDELKVEAEKRNMDMDEEDFFYCGSGRLWV